MAPILDTKHQLIFGYYCIIALICIIIIMSTLCIIDFIYQNINKRSTGRYQI